MVQSILYNAPFLLCYAMAAARQPARVYFLLVWRDYFTGFVYNAVGIHYMPHKAV